MVEHLERAIVRFADPAAAAARERIRGFYADETAVRELGLDL